MATKTYNADITFEGWRIGCVIKELRQARHWSQAYLAERLDIDEKTVGRWERGEIDFGRVACYMVVALARIFEVDVETILALRG